MFLPAGQRPTSAGYHCLIIGSGPAGMTTALQLADANRRVLMIESEFGNGDLPLSVGYGHLSGTYWNAHSIRALGGTSNAWTGWTSPLRAMDFDHPTIGVSWPMALDDLLPFYRLGAPYLDRHPSIASDHSQPVMPGWIYHPFSIQTPTRFGEKYRGTLASSKMIDVAAGYSVVSLEANSSRSLVTTLQAFDHATHTPFAIPVSPAQAVVVAAGGMGNAQLLLQPRADGARPVGNESGLAGRFLMEHPHFYSAGECVLAADLLRFAPPQRFGRSVHAIHPEPSLERERSLMGCSLTLSHQTQDHEFVRMFSRPGVPVFHYKIDARSEMRPTSANHVFITGERSRSGLYRPAARCVFSAEDLDNVHTTMRVLGEALIAQDRGRVRIDNQVLYREATGGGHIMGTTRMGRSRADSVVDRNCAVHGYRNFYVSGSSVFPTGGFANPTFTIVALAVRLADEIARHG
jgi:hypothetical protein